MPRIRTALRTLVAWSAVMSLISSEIATGQDTQPQTQPATAPAKALPDAKDILTQAIDAMGGKEAFDAIESTRIKATLSSPMGDADLLVYSAKPDKFYIEQTQGGATLVIGSNGEVGWMKHPMTGFQLLNKEQTEEIHRQSNMYRLVLNLADEFVSFETVDRTDFEGVDCYKVKLVDDDGQEQFAFFNAEKKLIEGFQVTQETPMGPQTDTVRFSEWKERDDVRVFTKATVERMGMQVIMSFTEVEFNKVEPATFDVPEEVKALQSKPSSPTTSPATQPTTTAPSAPPPAEDDGVEPEPQEDDYVQREAAQSFQQR